METQNRNPSWVATGEALRAALVKMQAEKVLAVDTEFIRETTFYPKLALLQVGTASDVWLIDPLAFTKEDLRPLLDLFVKPDVLKIMHAAHADQECLYTSYQMVATPVLDTSIAGALCGFGDSPGLGKLLRDLLNIHLPKGRARVRWLQRPLPQELLHYAEQDVLHLVELARVMEERLRKHRRFEWALAESEILASAFESTPQDIAERLNKSGQLDRSAFPVLLELVRWREERAKRGNLPRGWVADNETLLSLAKSKPRSSGELRSFRGLNLKEVERSGDQILSAIQRGLKAELPPATPRGRPSIPNESEVHILDLIQTYISFLASDLEIAPRYLVPSSSSFPLWKARQESIADWVKSGLLSNYAAELIGDELKALLQGGRGLAIQGDRVNCIHLATEVRA